MRRPLVAGNWKLNGSRSSNAGLLRALRASLPSDGLAEVLVCPPFVYLAEIVDALGGSRIAVGAQNLSAESIGAFTGEVSGAMLRDVGCTHAIVGHSERRALYDEKDMLVAKKFRSARAAGLIPILCVGETLEERQSGLTEGVVSRQLRAVLDSIDIGEVAASVIAYEPVWAIGTGQTASPAQAQEVHAFIRAIVSARNARIAADLRILYGGSVKGANARALFSMPDIDGGLVGGASLDAADFAVICGSVGNA